MYLTINNGQKVMYFGVEATKFTPHSESQIPKDNFLHCKATASPEFPTSAFWKITRLSNFLKSTLGLGGNTRQLHIG
jgi:hypothetical protein